MQRPEIFTRDVGWEQERSLGDDAHPEHRRSLLYEISDFTPSYEALGRLLKKKKKKKKNNDDGNSKIAYERFFV